MTRAARSLAPLMIAAVLLAAVPGFAWADGAKGTAVVNVDVVLASKKEGPTDRRLDKFREKLDDFAYRSYKLLSERTVSLAQGGSQSVDISGRTLKVTFSKVDKDGRARLKLSIPGVVDTTVSLARGGSVILGGPAMPHGDGVLFVPVTLSSVK